MPYINDYGAKSWVDVINDVGTGVRSSAEGLRQHNAKQAAVNEEQNRALHPLTQKYFQKVLSGEMPAAEAAAAAHAEIDANQNGIPDAQEAPKVVMSGLDNGSDGGTDMTPPIEPGTPSWDRGEGTPKVVQVPMTGMRSAASQPPAPAPIQRGEWPTAPLTNRNMPELEAISRDVAARRQARNNTLTDEQWRDREDIKTQNKIKVEEKKGGNALTLEDKKAETKKDLFKQGLEQAWKIEWQRHLDRLQAMKDELDIATLKGDGEAIARIHAEAVRYAADQGVVGKIRSSINDFASEEAQKEALELYNRSHRIATTMAAETSGPPPATKTKTKLKSKKTVKEYLVSPDGKIQVPVYEDGSKGPEEAGPRAKEK